MPAGVLIVEDEHQLAKNIETYLRRSGFDVRKTENASDGMSEFKQFKPDIVLLDFVLPDLDGLTLLHFMREFNPNAKVILMTSAANQALKPKAKKAGAYEFLTKPLRLKDLRTILEEALS